MNEITQQALRRASAQHGVVARSQLRADGLTGAQIQHLARTGGFVAVGPLVLRATGSADTSERRALESVFDAGPSAVLSHTSAAALWGLPGYRLEPCHVIGHRGRQHRTAPYEATVHEPRLLCPDHVTVLDGIPATSPPRTIFDLASLGLHPERVERALDAAWAQNLVNQRSMDTALTQLAKRGRRGSGLLRDLLADRRDHYRPPESGLEHRFQHVLGRHGLPPMRRQVDVGDGEQWIGRIDFVADGLRLLCRIQSARYHSALVDQRDDQRKNALLRAAGWVVIEFTDVDVWHRPERVAASVWDGIAQANRLLPGPPRPTRTGRVR